MLTIGMDTGERAQELASVEALNARMHAHMSNRTSDSMLRECLQYQLPRSCLIVAIHSPPSVERSDEDRVHLVYRPLRAGDDADGARGSQASIGLIHRLRATVATAPNAMMVADTFTLSMPFDAVIPRSSPAIPAV